MPRQSIVIAALKLFGRLFAGQDSVQDSKSTREVPPVEDVPGSGQRRQEQFPQSRVSVREHGNAIHHPTLFCESLFQSMSCSFVVFYLAYESQAA